MSTAGCSHDLTAHEMARRWGFRPREAHRHAVGWSQDQTAGRFTEATQQLRTDRESVPMIGTRIGEYERWPHGGRRPSAYVLTVLAAIYGTTVEQLLDYDDHRSLPPQERTVLAALLAGTPGGTLPASVRIGGAVLPGGITAPDVPGGGTVPTVVPVVVTTAGGGIGGALPPSPATVMPFVVTAAGADAADSGLSQAGVATTGRSPVRAVRPAQSGPDAGTPPGGAGCGGVQPPGMPPGGPAGDGTAAGDPAGDLTGSRDAPPGGTGRTTGRRSGSGTPGQPGRVPDFPAGPADPTSTDARPINSGGSGTSPPVSPAATGPLAPAGTPPDRLATPPAGHPTGATDDRPDNPGPATIGTAPTSTAGTATSAADVGLRSPDPGALTMRPAGPAAGDPPTSTTGAAARPFGGAGHDAAGNLAGPAGRAVAVSAGPFAGPGPGTAGRWPATDPASDRHSQQPATSPTGLAAGSRTDGSGPGAAGASPTGGLAGRPARPAARDAGRPAGDAQRAGPGRGGPAAEPASGADRLRPAGVPANAPLAATALTPDFAFAALMETLPRTGAAARRSRRDRLTGSAGRTTSEEEVIMAAADQSVEFTEWAEATNVGPSTLEQLEDDVRHIARAYLNSPPLPRLLDGVRLRNRVFTLLEGRQHPTQTRRLYLVAGRVCGLLGWMSGDVGRVAEGETQARAGWLCAELADDSGLRAWIRATQSKLAYWDGRMQDSVRLAEVGLKYGATDSARPLLACLAARSLARLGRPEDARTAMARAAEERAAVSAPDEVGGLFGFSEAQQNYLAGSTHLWLREPAEALRSADRAVELYRSGHPADRFYGAEMLALIDAATACLQADQLDGAAEKLAPVLQLPPERRLETFTQRLGEMRGVLFQQRYAGSRAATDLRNQIEDFRAGALSQYLSH